MRFLFLILFVSSLAASLLSGISSAQSLESSFHLNSLEVVKYVDPIMYSGKWFEISRLPNYFQKDCSLAFAAYSITSQDNLEVENRRLKVCLDTGLLRFLPCGRGEY